MKSAQVKGKGNRSASTTPNKPDFRKLVEKGQDTHFSYNMTVLIGCSAEVTTRNGEKYEGIFVAYSSSQEIMLEAAHLVTSDNDESAISTHYDVLIIPSDKLMAMKFENAVLSYATREFQTDAAISSARNASTANKELMPWDGGDANAVDHLDLGDGGTNGWAPGEMFKKNAEKYGVVSSYDQHLSGYTTSLDKSDTETFKKHEEQASQIAEEIEKNVASVERSSAENGDDEEAKFSAVVRDTAQMSLNNNNNNNSISSTGNEIRTEKYVPPSRRNTNQSSQATNSPSANSNTSTPQPQPQHHQQMSGGGGNTRKPNYSGPRNSYASSGNNFYQGRNFDRRGPIQSQYGPSSSHGENNSRQGRGGKASMDRRGPPRDDPIKKDLMEFHSTYPLSSENPQNRRPSGPHNVSQHSPMNHVSPQATNQQQRVGAQNGSHAISPSTATPRNSVQKTEKEKPAAVTPTADLPPPKVEKPVRTSPQTPAETQTRKNDSPEAVREEDKNVAVASPAPSETRSVTGSEKGDVKSLDSTTDSKPKPFTFNVNAKEFNPNAKSFTSKSPATPPRPPSTPASTPQQLMPVAQTHPPFLTMPPAIYLAPPPYSQTINPGTTQSLSSNNLPPQRHINPHRKSMGVAQRAELTSAIPVQAAGLLAQGSLPNTGPAHPQYPAYTIPHQHSGFVQQIRIHAPGMVPVYNSDTGGDGNPIHVGMHYMPAGHPSNSPVANASGQNSVIPGSPHYTQSGGSHGPQQHHVGYHHSFVGLPVVGYPHGPTPLLNVNHRYYE